MTPQERETARWKARLRLADSQGTWVGGTEGEHCAVGGSKPKLCLPTREAAQDHRKRLLAQAEGPVRLSVLRCSFGDHYHVGKP
jgi:hypothetical protein